MGERDALEVLDEVGLARAPRPPGGRRCPYGTQKRVELARALAARPRLLLLDEPAGGLNHEEVEELGGFIRRIRDERQLTVLLVEHHMNLVMSISDHVHRAQLRAQDRGRRAGAGAARPGRDRGLPRDSSTTTGGAVTALLELEGVEARYGPVQALRGVSLEVAEGEIVAVLGANGAGKTTTLRAVSGTVRRSGSIRLAGESLRGGPEARREQASRTCPRGAARSAS